MFVECDPNLRRRVSRNSYLDIECHWCAILQSLFRHNTSGLDTLCDPDDYCVIDLAGTELGNGTVEGNRNAKHKLVIVNWGDTHFDPCLPL